MTPSQTDVGPEEIAPPRGVHPPVVPRGRLRRTAWLSVEIAVARSDRWPLVTAVGASMLAAAFAFRLAGVPRVPLMQPLYALGVVLPSCGLTRATVALFAGDSSAAWAYNPASYAVAVAVFAALLRAGVGVTFGRWVHLRLRPSPAIFGVIGVAVAVLWLRQQRSAELLMG